MKRIAEGKKERLKGKKACEKEKKKDAEMRRRYGKTTDQKRKRHARGIYKMSGALALDARLQRRLRSTPIVLLGAGEALRGAEGESSAPMLGELTTRMENGANAVCLTFLAVLARCPSSSPRTGGHWAVGSRGRSCTRSTNGDRGVPRGA